MSSECVCVCVLCLAECACLGRSTECDEHIFTDQYSRLNHPLCAYDDGFAFRSPVECGWQRTSQPSQHNHIASYICIYVFPYPTQTRHIVYDYAIMLRENSRRSFYICSGLMCVCVCVKWVFWVHKVCAYGLHSHTCIRKHTQLMYKHTHTHPHFVFAERDSVCPVFVSMQCVSFGSV